MFGQKFTNTNEMLQCLSLHCADLGAANLAQLNTALVLMCVFLMLRRLEAYGCRVVALLVSIVRSAGRRRRRLRITEAARLV
jgi:hypothetical protein